LGKHKKVGKIRAKEKVSSLAKKHVFDKFKTLRRSKEAQGGLILHCGTTPSMITQPKKEINIQTHLPGKYFVSSAHLFPCME
jgi:hypothetical protein